MLGFKTTRYPGCALIYPSPDIHPSICSSSQPAAPPYSPTHHLPTRPHPSPHPRIHGAHAVPGAGTRDGTYPRRAPPCGRDPDGTGQPCSRGCGEEARSPRRGGGREGCSERAAKAPERGVWGPGWEGISGREQRTVGAKVQRPSTAVERSAPSIPPFWSRKSRIPGWQSGKQQAEPTAL